MVSVTAVIGAVAGTVGTINILKTWVEQLLELLKKYEDVGKTLQNLDLSLLVHQTDLNLWMKIWHLEQPTSRRFQSELWGTQELFTIERLYVAISSSLDETRTQLADILQDSGMLRPKAYKPVQLGSTTLIEFRDQAIGAKKNLPFKKIVDFVRKNGSELEAKLTDVAKWVEDIRDTSISAYQTKHHVAISGVLTKEEMEKAETSMLLQMALDNRYASMGLYKSYRERVESKTIKLDVDLINDKAIEIETVKFRNSVAVRYRFVVPWPTKPQEPLEILIEGPFTLENSNSSPNPLSSDQGFIAACHAALGNEKLEFRIQNRAEIYAFRVQVPCGRIIGSSAAVLSPLRSLLYSLDISIAEEAAISFPRSQRIKLAYKLVQCGLLISGTPWLSTLQSQIVKRTPRDENEDYHFLLDLSCSIDGSDESILSAIAEHLFAIGVLLVELGLGKVVSSLTWDNRSDDWTKAAKYCLALKKGDCWHTIRQSDTEPALREKAFAKILKEYYIGAYLPMRNLVQIAERHLD